MMEPPVAVFVMEEVKLCRICLNGNVKMCKLEGNLLETYSKHVLAGLYTKNISEQLHYACYECVYNIKKYCSFREKCLRGQSVLLQIYERNGMVTENGLKSIDRMNLGLCSNFVLTGPFVYNICHETEQVDVKVEPSTNNISDIDDFGIFLKLYEVKAEYDLKEEDNVAPILEFPDDEHHTEEHTSERNVSKRLRCKKVAAKRLQSRKKSEDDCQKSNDSLNSCTKKTTQNDKDVTDLETKQPKRKRTIKNDENVTDLEMKQPKRKKTVKKNKIAADLEMKQRKRSAPKCHPSGYTPEEFNMKDDMTVIKLSVEEQLEEVTKRQHSSNYLKAVFKCTFCYKGFVDPVAFDHHMKRHDPSSGSVKCQICKLCFPTRMALRKHTGNHEKKYICKTCSYVCSTLTQAKQHQNGHKGKVYNCKHCGNTSMKWTSHLSHIRIKHPSDFVCDVCGFSFVSELGLTKHRTMMHKNVTVPQSSNIDKQIPYCKVCDVQSNSFQTWRKHVNSIAHKIKENIDFTCVVCGETLKSGDQLRLHHRLLHPQRRYINKNCLPAVWPRKCLHCDEQIPDARKFASHFRKMHPHKQYPIAKDHICDICGKRYRGNAFMQYHRRTHFDDRPYKCQQCPKAFFNRFNLLEHKKIHSDHRPFACTSCSKTFKTNGALSRHALSHTGEKPYECSVCGKAFSQSNSRNVHMKTVHLKEPMPYVSRTRLKKRRPHTQAASPTEHSDNYID